MKNIITNIFAKLALVAGLVLASTLSWGQTVNVLTLDCATPAPTGTTSTALSSTSDVATFLNSAAGLSSAANKITSSAKSGDVYKGKGNGGGDIPQQCLKIGKASGGGGFTFTIPSTYDAIDVVELTCYGWKTTSSISINSGTAQTFTTAQSVTTKTFDLATSSRTINISVKTSAVCVTEIVLKKKSGGSSAAATTTTISAAGITNTDVYEGTAAGSLSASVTAGGNPIDGASVTWSGNNEAVATINASSGVVTLVAAGTVTFTASYAGDSGTYQASSDTYEMTVTNSAPYEQPTKIEITPNYTFWGKTGQFSGSTYNELSGGKDNVTLVWSRGSGSTYANSSAMRFYKDNELTFTAPTGYEIKSIDLTVSDTYSDLAFSPSGWNGTDTKWTGSSETVTMSRPSNASSYAGISKFTIIIGAPSTVTTPTISPADGTTFGNDGLDVTISAANGTIYYTLDGTAPTSSSSAYSEVIHITTTTTVKAIAVDGSDVSNVASATYTYVDPNAPGTQNNPYTVSQARAAIDAETGVTGVYATGIVSKIVTEYSSTYHNISYNISSDGLMTSDQLQAYRGKSYNGDNFTSADDIQVGDIVVVYGNLKKYNSTYEFDQNNQLVSLVRKPAAPTFSPAAGAVMEGTEVTISTTTDGATIYYTTDGTEPTTESSVYSAAIEINGATTIKAIAVKDAASSDVATAAYTIAAPVATPTFSPAAGTYTSVQSVEISCETEGATIHYTTNGDTPSTSSPEYSGAIYVNQTMTIKAIAVKDGMANSSVAEAAYTINIPSIVFNEGNSLEVESSDTEASIAFTASFTSGSISVVLCDVNGDTQEYDWIIADIDNNNVVLAFDENASTTNSRTAYFKLTADNATSSVFTLTQKLFVVDYAELPFKYDGNGTGTLPTGLTVSGTGTYDSSPKIKFDGTGDYVIMKINEEPGILTFDIKGNNFSGGTFKVQTSADGANYSDLNTYTALGNTQSSEEFDNLNSNVRYIKWIYTNKSNGNVALGNIALEKPVASIVPAALLIEASSEETDGTLNVTYKKIESNPEIQWFESNGETSASKPSWIETDFDSSNNVEYLIEENTGSERSAYFKVYGLDGSENGVYSELVTITQEAFVEDPVIPEGDNYTLFTGNLVEGDYIIYYNGYAMKNAQISGKSRLDYEVITPDKNVINTANASIVWHIAQSGDYWTLYNVASGTYAASNGTKNEAQMLADGTDDKALWSLESSLESSFEFINKYNSANSLNCNLRNNGTNGFACYSTSTGGALSLYKLDAPATAESVNATLNGGRYWSTFYSGVARYKLPEGTKAYTLNSSNKLYLLGSDGSVIPAGTAVIIISDTATPSLTQIPNVGAISVYGDENILRGSSSGRAVSGLSGTPYVMGVVGGTLGFYKYTGETIPAGKAYYIVNE